MNNSEKQEPALGDVTGGAALRPRSLKTNFLWTLAGNSIYAGCLWGMLIFLAKITDQETVGQFALALAISAPVFMFTGLQLRNVQATDAKNQYLFSDYLRLRILTTIFGVLVVALIILIAGYRGRFALIIIGMGLAKGFNAVSDIYFGLMQKHERMDMIAKSMMIKGPLSLAAIIITVYFTGELIWGIAALVISWAAVLFTYDLHNGRLILAHPGRTPLKPEKVHNNSIGTSFYFLSIIRLKDLIMLSLPLGAAMMLISLNANIPRYFIEHYSGFGELGIFAALAAFMTAGMMIVNSLGHAAMPRLAKYYSRGEVKDFLILLIKSVFIGIIIGGVGIIAALIAGEQILTIVYTPAYAEHSGLFVLIMAVTTLGNVASLLGYGMTAARYFKTQLPVFIGVAIILTISSILLIPAYGIWGAAMAIGIARLFQAVGCLVVVVHALRHPPQSEKLSHSSGV